MTALELGVHFTDIINLTPTVKTLQEYCKEKSTQPLTIIENNPDTFILIASIYYHITKDSDLRVSKILQIKSIVSSPSYTIIIRTDDELNKIVHAIQHGLLSALNTCSYCNKENLTKLYVCLCNNKICASCKEVNTKCSTCGNI